jgi:hypothetical protein
LAVSVGAVLLLPISILANEALLVFPNSYYLQWVNSSLIHGLYLNVESKFRVIFCCCNIYLLDFLLLILLLLSIYFLLESNTVYLVTDMLANWYLYIGDRMLALVKTSLLFLLAIFPVLLLNPRHYQIKHFDQLSLFGQKVFQHHLIKFVELVK